MNPALQEANLLGQVEEKDRPQAALEAFGQAAALEPQKARSASEGNCKNDPRLRFGLSPTCPALVDFTLRVDFQLLRCETVF